MSPVISQPDDLGLWRFGIISPLLHRTEDAPTMRADYVELSKRVFYTPQGAEKHLSPDTLRDWLYRYRKMGIDGLRNKQRKDRGSTMVPLSLQKAISDLRKIQPQWTVKRLLRNLADQGVWNGVKPSKSALYRFTTSSKLTRTSQQAALPVRSFEFPHFGDLWSADFLHGPKVRKGTFLNKVYLNAIIDDATRYIVAAKFHEAEDTRSLLDDLMLGIRRFGIPRRLYTDNGAAFRSHHLRLVAAKLGIALPHTPPYTPRGRGKIERFFRSVRDGFLTGRATSSLDKLNSDFSVWLTAYHSSVHRTLGCSPLDSKLTKQAAPLKQIDATVDINNIFRMEELKRVGSDGCVRMFKKRFEIPDAIVGESVKVFYLPWDQEYLLAGEDKLLVKPVDTVKNALRFDKPRRGKPPLTQQENNQ